MYVKSLQRTWLRYERNVTVMKILSKRLVITEYFFYFFSFSFFGYGYFGYGKNKKSIEPVLTAA